MRDVAGRLPLQPSATLTALNNCTQKCLFDANRESLIEAPGRTSVFTK